MAGRGGWRWATRFILGVGLVGLSLEVVYRVVTWWVQIAPIMVADQDRGWRFGSNLRFQVNSREGPYLLQVNSRGFRDKEYRQAKPAGMRRIIVLGGSNTVGVGVDQPDIFTEVLERTLPDTEVINMACFLYDPAQQYVGLEIEGLDYEPDLVLQTFNGCGDTCAVRELGQTGNLKCWLDRNQSTVTIHPPDFPWWQHWTRHSALLHVTDFLLLPRPEDEVADAKATASDPRTRQAVEKLILATRDLARSHSARYLALYLPLSEDIDGNMLEILLALEERGAIDLVNLAPLFAEHFKRPDAPELIDKADWHLTEYCHYTIAQAVADFLQQQPYWKNALARSR